MSCNLFHSFDPNVNFVIYYIPLKWLVVLFFSFFLSWQFFFSLVGLELVVKKFVVLVWLSFKSLMKSLKSAFVFVFSMISLVYLMNIIGLVPYVFTFTSHLSVNLSFSLCLWLSGVVLSLMNSVDKFLSHLVPTGTPMVLWVFLVMVELVSQVIRPLTLSIRLMANVMAGHLIMNLLGQLVSSSSLSFWFVSLQIAFLFFEFWISLVQAYVFVSLLSLYWDECE